MAAAFPDLAPRTLASPPPRSSAPDAALPIAGSRSAESLGGITGAVFPADPDPTGARALLVSSEDLPGGRHVEHLWVAPLSGEGPPVELASSQFLRNPEWSRDGAFVVYESDAKSFRDLFRSPADGSAPPTRLTDAPHGTFEPAISPDGTRLAMGTSRDGNAEIWTSAPDGSDARRFTDHPLDDVHPAWLPDGRLSWISHRQDGMPRVWVRDFDGAQHPLREEERAVIDHDVAWSAGGVAAIVAQSGPEDVELQLRTAHGNLVATLDGPGPDEHPSWSPDGAWVAFASSRSGTPQIWIASADGRELRQVSRCTAPCWLPRWLPPEAGPTSGRAASGAEERGGGDARLSAEREPASGRAASGAEERGGGDARLSAEREPASGRAASGAEERGGGDARLSAEREPASGRAASGAEERGGGDARVATPPAPPTPGSGERTPR